ncbi:MAG: sugar phosphate isomerase/epimerase family protein [Acutalibacteraceae bacterium]
MKRSFTTLGCPDWSFDRILKEAGRMGYTGVEIRGIDGVMRAEEIPLFFPENLEQTRAYIRAHGLELVGFGTSAAFHDAERAAAGLDEGKKAIDVCAAAGIPFIRVFGDQIPDAAAAAETVEAVGRAIAQLCAYAAGKGVDVLLEIHGDFNTVEAVSGVIRICGQYSSFGILWDVEHSDRAYGDGWRAFYDVIRPYVRHTHFKDHIRNADGTFTLCLPGEGHIPLLEIAAALRKDGYSGYYSLEWEKKWHPELPEPEEALAAYRVLMDRAEQAL